MSAFSTSQSGALSTPLGGAANIMKSEIADMCNNIDIKDNKIYLTDKDKKLILNGSMLNDNHVDKFHSLLNEKYEIPSTSLIKKSIQFSKFEELKVHDRNKPHLQLLHSCSDLCINCRNAHWVCCYYDTKSLFIYDSKNEKILHPSNISFLKKFFDPFFFELPINFQPVQRQTNADDGILFAIAFATSIFFDNSPVNVSYKIENLRPHLYLMFQNNKLSRFRTERKKIKIENDLSISSEASPNMKKNSKNIDIDSNNHTSNPRTIENGLWNLEKNKILNGS